jgi:hypothetical protein
LQLEGYRRREEANAAIRVLAKDGVPIKRIARQLGCSRKLVRQVIRGEYYAVRIVLTPCNLGGWRAWFVCPAVGCGQRVAILYGGSIFACRHCYQLAYTSAREDAGDRAARRADRLRARLAWKPGILNGRGGKPRWMRCAGCGAGRWGEAP